MTAPGQTKYNIDQNLTGEERKKAENAAKNKLDKKAKKGAKGDEGKHGIDDVEGADGASVAA